MAIFFILYRLRFVRQRRRQGQACIPGDEQPVSKFIVRKGRAVEVSQLSRPPSIISRHSSARNRMSVYSKLSLGNRKRNDSPCGSPRYWPVSIYSTHSQGHTPGSQGRSTLSGYRHPLPLPSVKAQNKGQWNESKETHPCTEEGSLHPIDGSITEAHPVKRWNGSFTKINGTPSAQSSQGVFSGTVTPSVEVDIMLGTPAKSSLTSQSTLPGSLGECSSLMAVATEQIAPKTLPIYTTSGTDVMLSRHVVVAPGTQDGTNTPQFATCCHDGGHIKNFKPYTEANLDDDFCFVPFSSTTSPRSFRDAHEVKHHRPRESISSMRTFDSDKPDVYTVGHARSVMLPADPRTSALARPPTIHRPLSRYRVPVENRYAKALPSLPPVSHIRTRPKTADVVNLEMKTGLRRQNVSHRNSAPDPSEVKDARGGLDGSQRLRG